MAGVYSQSFLIAQNVSQVRTILVLIKGKNPYMFTDPLQLESSVHNLSSLKRPLGSLVHLLFASRNVSPCASQSSMVK